MCFKTHCFLGNASVAASVEDLRLKLVAHFKELCAAVKREKEHLGQTDSKALERMRKMITEVIEQAEEDIRKLQRKTKLLHFPEEMEEIVDQIRCRELCYSSCKMALLTGALVHQLERLRGPEYWSSGVLKSIQGNLGDHVTHAAREGAGHGGDLCSRQPQRTRETHTATALHGKDSAQKHLACSRGACHY